MGREALVTLVAIAVTAVWSLTILLSIVTEDPTIAGIATPVMIIIATGLFALQRNGRNGRA